MESRNALIVGTGTPYWSCGTYNYKGMTRRDFEELFCFLSVLELARRPKSFNLVTMLGKELVTCISITYPNNVEAVRCIEIFIIKVSSKSILVRQKTILLRKK